MAAPHNEPGVLEPEDVLLSWPFEAVTRHLIPDEAHKQAVEFKKQSGASPRQIDDLMDRFNDGLDLDKYFERKLEERELEWEAGPAKAE